MNGKSIIIKLVVFFIIFTIFFFGIRRLHLLPSATLIQNNSSLPWLFSAIGLMFSIISGFIIQSKWNTWNELLDSTHGELSSLQQLYGLAHHFPKSIYLHVQKRIVTYLQLIIEEAKYNQDLNIRSEQVDTAIFELEETVFNIDYSEHPQIGAMAFDLVRKCMDFREKRLQNIAHKLPLGVKVFIFVTTFSTVFTSLFIGVTSIAYDYLFTSIIALLSYGIYLLIDDLDHPYNPGQWHLSIEDYKKVLKKVEK